MVWGLLRSTLMKEAAASPTGFHHRYMISDYMHERPCSSVTSLNWDLHVRFPQSRVMESSANWSEAIGVTAGGRVADAVCCYGRWTTVRCFSSSACTRLGSFNIRRGQQGTSPDYRSLFPRSKLQFTSEMANKTKLECFILIKLLRDEVFFEKTQLNNITFTWNK